MTDDQAAMLRRVEIRLDLASLREQQGRLFASHKTLKLDDWPQGARDLVTQIGQELHALTAELESLGGRWWMK